MGIFSNIINSIVKVSIPTYRFVNNKLVFKLNSDEFFEYDLGEYDIKTRHDSYVMEAYTLNNSDIFLEFIKLDNNASWNGSALSLYEDFFKSKLNIKEIETIEKKEIGNYTFKVKKVDESFVLHMIHIFMGNTNIIIVDMKGELYKSLLKRLIKEYNYRYDEELKGEVNFNISLVKENSLKGFFNASN